MYHCLGVSAFNISLHELQNVLIMAHYNSYTINSLSSLLLGVSTFNINHKYSSTAGCYI